MATMTVLGQDQKIRGRVEELEQMRLVITGQITDLRGQLADRETQLARIQGAIVELSVLIIPQPQGENPEGEKPAGEPEKETP